jgi:hypothetical protein
MKKILAVLFIVLLMAIAGVVYYVVSNLDAIIEAAIEDFGSDAVKTSVEVEKVETWLTAGTAVIYGVNVDNPEGFSMPRAFSLDEIAVDINLEKTDQETIAIDLIKIVAPRVYYEINEQRQGSLNVLKDNLDTGDASAVDAPSGTADSSGGQHAAMKIAIARFSFSEASLHAKIAPLNDKTYDLKLPSLVLTDLNGTPDQISRQLLDKLIDHAEKEIRKQGLDRELAEIKARAQQRLDEEKEKLEQQADERLEAEKSKAGDKLKNLLGR